MGHIIGEGRGQSALFPLCLEDLIPADHACRVIDAFVDSLAMEALGFARSQPAGTGRPGYDPRDLLKLYVYGYLQQVRSSRRLEAECRRNVEVMWLLGRLVPDHKVIAEFRRLHREAVAEAGASLIRWARAQAMLASGWVAIDGSKFRSVSSTRSVAAAREAMQRYLAGLDEADEAPPAHPEPEARLMRSAQEGHVAAYNVQTAVDAATGLIVAHEVTTEATDNRSLLPMADKARTVVACKDLHVVADAGYSNGEQARACEEQGIVTHVPANRAVNNQGDGTLYDRSAFTYDEATDTMRCPAGRSLVRKQTHRGERMVVYAAQASDCGGCVLKDACTRAERRLVRRHWDEAVLERMNARATPEAMRLRRCTVERPFAELKERHMGRRFLLRGLDGSRCEMALAVMAFNLKRLIRLLGAVALIGKLQPAG
ncbi:MAG: transposase [Xanthomonadaceae bacterium]|nr:transposase [Xanthomonadaceae bacterium]